MNKEKLMYEMQRRHVSIQEMIGVLGMSRSAFYRKCNGISEFTEGEIRRIIDYLDLESPMGIFFAEKVVQKDTMVAGGVMKENVWEKQRLWSD